MRRSSYIVLDFFSVEYGSGYFHNYKYKICHFKLIGCGFRYLPNYL
jgi:hypothetical protein